MLDDKVLNCFDDFCACVADFPSEVYTGKGSISVVIAAKTSNMQPVHKQLLGQAEGEQLGT